MTKAEVTQIFAVLSMAYPSAELFKAPSKEALEKKLAPTIALWATCLRDVDFWTGQKAAVKVCQNNKFLPSIAEMREAAEEVNREVSNQAKDAFEFVCNICALYGPEKAYEQIDRRSKKVIDTMGGMKAFAPPGKGFYSRSAFVNTYMTFLRGNPTGLPSAKKVQNALEN